MDLVEKILVSGFALASPLIIASMGELISQRAGVLNIGIEGFLLMGAMAGFWASYLSGNPYVGMLAGLAFGAALALIHLVLCVHWQAPQLMSGIGINIFALGATSLWYTFMIGAYGLMHIGYFLPLEIPVLSSIPFVGTIFFRQNIYFYLAICLVFLFSMLLFKTKFGLTVRAVGENPEAAETMGINVIKIRYIATILSGALGGLGGSFFTLGYSPAFMEGMTAGRGFIVLAIIIAAGWAPSKIFFISLLFGVADALSLRLEFLVDVPYPLLLILPYIVTLMVLIIKRKVITPLALAKPYVRKR